MLHLPLLRLCNQASTDISFLQSIFLMFKASRDCSKPSLWATVTAVVRSNDIQFSSSLPSIYLTSLVGPEPLPVSGGGIDLLPYFCQKLFYQSITIFFMFDTELRAMYMRNRPSPVTSPRVDANQLIMASFLQTKMLSAARNLWLRLIHNKVSSEVNLYHILRLPGDLFEYCGQHETTSHMLFICPINLEIWPNYFAMVFLPSGSMEMSEVYRNVMLLNLSSYRLIDSPLNVSVFEAVTYVITAIWRAKWRSYYDNVGFDNQSVVTNMRNNFFSLSFLNGPLYITPTPFLYLPFMSFASNLHTCK